MQDISSIRHSERHFADALNGRTDNSTAVNGGDCTVSFMGGTLKYGTDSWTDKDNPADVTTDWSALVKNSTDFISVDTNGKDVTWVSESLKTNNADAKGIAKSGEGTLSLTGSNRDGTWGFFTSSECTNRIDGGTLAIMNTKYNATGEPQAKFLGTGTLKIMSSEANGGYRLAGTTAFNEFEGTIDYAVDTTSTEKTFGFFLKNSNLDMSKARLRITGNPSEAGCVMRGEGAQYSNNGTLTVGAFDHLYPNAQIYMNKPWKLNILGNKGASDLNGAFANGAVTITKTGDGALAIGEGFSAPDGSSVAVNEGTFVANADLTGTLNYTLNISGGVKVSGAGTGKVTAAQLAAAGGYSVKATGGAALTVDGTVNLSIVTLSVDLDGVAEAGTDKTYTLLKATSFTGTPDQTIADSLNTTAKGGRWKLVSDGGNLTLQFIPYGLSIIVR